MSPLEMGKLRSGLVFSTGGLVPGKRMTRSPSPVCTEHEEKGGPHGEELQRRTTEPKPK